MSVEYLGGRTNDVQRSNLSDTAQVLSDWCGIIISDSYPGADPGFHVNLGANLLKHPV